MLVVNRDLGDLLALEQREEEVLGKRQDVLHAADHDLLQPRFFEQCRDLVVECL